MFRYEWAGSLGVIPEPHRKLALNNSFVVFQTVSIQTLPFPDRDNGQRTYDS